MLDGINVIDGVSVTKTKNCNDCIIINEDDDSIKFIMKSQKNPKGCSFVTLIETARLLLLTEKCKTFNSNNEFAYDLLEVITKYIEAENDRINSESN